MKYEIDYDAFELAKDIITKLNFDYIDCKRIVFLKSWGSKSRSTLARIHGMSKVMQIALRTDAVYVIELITENFDKLSDDDKTKTIIHELMHIPKCFGGGFRSHKPYVTKKKVDKAFQNYKRSFN